MSAIEPEHPLSYRQEVTIPLFQLIRARDSGVIIGGASMGKSRLLQFILRPDVQQHYLGEMAATSLLILVDCHRLAEVSEWGLYELLLTTLIESCSRVPEAPGLRAELNTLRRDAIESRDAILARRHVELACHLLCRDHRRSLCFILDEFDETYQTLPAAGLANLRALRDAHKYQIGYILMLRDEPARLRRVADHEGFYEILSRAVLGLGPYSRADAERVVTQLMSRKQQQLSADQRSALLNLSGGHPGMIVALFDLLTTQPPAAVTREWALAQPTIRDECVKLWGGLAEDERVALSRIAHTMPAAAPIRTVLLRKGLIETRESGDSIFSPLFAAFVRVSGSLHQAVLRLDEASRTLHRGEQRIANVTAREFDLLVFLYRHLGQVCSRESILRFLYPDESREYDHELQENRVDTLVKRVREKIEPIPQRPQYLLTVRSKGYKLVDEPLASAE